MINFETFKIELFAQEHANKNMLHLNNAFDNLDINLLTERMSTYDATAKAIADRVETGLVVF